MSVATVATSLAMPIVVLTLETLKEFGSSTQPNRFM